MPSVHLRRYLNQFSPENRFERLFNYLDRCVSTIHISRHLASHIGITVWCCASSKNILIMYITYMGLHAPSFLSVRGWWLISWLMTTCDLFRCRLKPKACSLSSFAPYCSLDGETCYITSHTLPVVYLFHQNHPTLLLLLYTALLKNSVW